MSQPVESKWNQLRKSAVDYYEATIFPCSSEVFDQVNPQPRIALNIELDRINQKEWKEGKSW